METDVPAAPIGKCQLLKPTTNSLELSWLACPTAEAYLLQIQKVENYFKAAAVAKQPPPPALLNLPQPKQQQPTQLENHTNNITTGMIKLGQGELNQALNNLNESAKLIVHQQPQLQPPPPPPQPQIQLQQPQLQQQPLPQMVFSANELVAKKQIDSIKETIFNISQFNGLYNDGLLFSKPIRV